MTQETLSQETIDEFVVAAHHDLPRVQELLAEQPDLLNENATWIETPIQAAAHVGNRPIAEYLLDQGAPLDICTASMMGLTEDVKALLADNPELSGATGAHNIPLMFYPALSDNTEIAQILFDAGADVNAGEGGNTPLHGAAITGHVNVLRWLLDHDANPYAVDYEGKTPLDRAQANNHDAAAAILQPFFDESNGA
ncbi:MAG: ankyrin repeat domain-containing protein [Chloroflexota bacterium]